MDTVLFNEKDGFVLDHKILGEETQNSLQFTDNLQRARIYDHLDAEKLADDHEHMHLDVLPVERLENGILRTCLTKEQSQDAFDGYEVRVTHSHRL